MATIFLGCFIFGALCTTLSLVLGVGGHGAAAHHGAVAQGHALAHGHAAHVGHGHAADQGAVSTQHELPLFNASSLLAFLTLFGGVGYSLTSYADWVLLPALIGAVLAGAIGWVLIALLLRTVLAGEVELDPADFRLIGTLGQVSHAIPPHGSGEVVFKMGGTHRGEAARTADGRPIGRGTEVVITRYEHGFATVEPWAEYLAASGATQTALEQPPEDDGR